jgi:hypothetical protein
LGVELPELTPIEYRGELVALVSRERIHIISPWLLTLAAGDADLRFVGFMCLCCVEVLNDRVTGPFSSAFAEEWARLALIAEADLEELEGMSDADAAALLNVPVEQLGAARSPGS